MNRGEEHASETARSVAWIGIVVIAVLLVLCSCGACMLAWFALGGMDTIMSA